MSGIETNIEPNLDLNVDDSVINEEAAAEILNKATDKVNKITGDVVDGVDVLNVNRDETDSEIDEDTDDPKTDSETDDDNEVITLTKKELQAIKDSESDIKVAKVIKKKQLEWDAEKAKIISDKTEEFEKYSKLTASEKQQKEIDVKLLEIQDALKEIEDSKLEHSTKVKKFNDERLLENIKKDLILNELPENLAPILFKLDDADKIKQALEDLKEDFSLIIKNKTAKYSQTKAPQVSNTTDNSSKHRMSAVEMIKAARQNNK